MRLKRFYSLAPKFGTLFERYSRLSTIIGEIRMIGCLCELLLKNMVNDKCFRSSSPANIAIVTSSGSAVVASTSNGAPSAPSPTRERFCFPVFFDHNGRRKLLLTVDIGLAFTAKEITVLIIKENRIQIKGRHEERTAEKLCKRKYTKEFELPEKIETYSLRGGLTVDGKLIVSALGKGHAASLNKVTAGELVEDDINARAENHSCNVLDLSTFPPTTPQLIASSYNN